MGKKNNIKLFIYPQHKEGQSLNPYLNNMENALSSCFKMVHPDYVVRLPQPFRFLIGSFIADVYVCNWLERAAYGDGPSFLRGLLAMLAIRIISLRKAKLVWIFHNIHPHEGENWWSINIKEQLCKKSSLIISHSEEAAEYIKTYARCPVIFKNHPTKKNNYQEWDGAVKSCDFYLWGTILPYKGVVEFINNPMCQSTKCKVLIVGECKDDNLRQAIVDSCDDNIIFENRRPDFNEIAAQCKKAKFVIFPYVGDSISSSGALIDTLQMGGIPIGPDRGAFADLKKIGCCITYNSIDEVFSFLNSDNDTCKLNPNHIKKFIDDNTWENFALWLYQEVSKF